MFWGSGRRPPKTNGSQTTAREKRRRRNRRPKVRRIRIGRAHQTSANGKTKPPQRRREQIAEAKGQRDRGQGHATQAERRPYEPAKAPDRETAAEAEDQREKRRAEVDGRDKRTNIVLVV